MQTMEITYYNTLYKRDVVEKVTEVNFKENYQNVMCALFCSMGHRYSVEMKYVKNIKLVEC